jgi:peptide/nickel transport system permease protein
MKRLKSTFQEIWRYPSAVVGLVIILILLIVSVYTLFAIPYNEAVKLWRGGEDIWYSTPKNAHPKWVNWFRSEKLPDTIVINSQDEDVEKTYVKNGDTTEITYTYTFDYNFDGFPDELSLYFTSQFNEKLPHVSLNWVTPDGREIRISSLSLDKSSQTYRVSQDDRLQRKLKGQYPQIGLFADPNIEEPTPLKGTYQLRVEGIVFEEGADIDSEFVLFGKVYGMAGTDHRRRDLSIALLWGTPIAIIFGLVAAVGTTVLTMIISGVGVWYGGWLDELIQRVTEVNLILPTLPILIMVGTFYSRTIWTMLGVIILLSIFGGAIKTYRAIFLQVKQSPYIEAAQAYGASNSRVIFNYLIPRIIPLLIPAFVIQIPAYVFLEASLAVLGLGDPVIPTWGKIINDANSNGALYDGLYYWVLEPSILLMVTGLAFAMVGYSLDRIFNPRLRGM